MGVTEWGNNQLFLVCSVLPPKNIPCTVLTTHRAQNPRDHCKIHRTRRTNPTARSTPTIFVPLYSIYKQHLYIFALLNTRLNHAPTTRKCWLESSFVGNRPLDSPQTPTIEQSFGTGGAAATATSLAAVSHRRSSDNTRVNGGGKSVYV